MNYFKNFLIGFLIGYTLMTLLSVLAHADSDELRCMDYCKTKENTIGYELFETKCYCIKEYEKATQEEIEQREMETKEAKNFQDENSTETTDVYTDLNFERLENITLESDSPIKNNENKEREE